MNRLSKQEMIGLELPYGVKKEIANITGLSTTTVNEFFKGYPKSAENSSKILDASKPFLEVSKQKEQELKINILIGKELPYGAKKKIAKITGITEQTVVNFYNGLWVRKDNAIKIAEASKPFLEENRALLKAKYKIIGIGQELPQGAKKNIAKTTGISEQTICKFFKTGTAKPETASKILEASKPFLEHTKELKKLEVKRTNLFKK